MLAKSAKPAFAAIAITACSLLGFPARAQEPTDEARNEQDDLTRPVTNLDIRYRYEDQTTASRQQLIVRNDWKIDLSGSWKIGLRFDADVTASNAADAGNPAGDYQLGMGRLLAQAYLADILNDRWAYAFGARIRTPAPSGTTFGNGNWDIDPILGARVMLSEITEGSYFEPVLLYAQSFAQSFPGTTTSRLEAGPQLKIDLPADWFVELYPTTDIRWNFGEKANGQTGRLFLPFDAQIGRNIGKSLVTSLEVSVPIVKDYPVYKLKIVTRVAYKF